MGGSAGRGSAKGARKMGGWLGGTRTVVEQAAVIMAHDSQAIVFHRVSDAARFDPCRDLIPRKRVVVEHAGDLQKRDMATTKYTCDFRHRTSLAISQPFAGHFGSVAHLIAGLVVNRRGGRKIYKDYRNSCSSYNRKDSR